MHLNSTNSLRYYFLENQCLTCVSRKIESADTHQHEELITKREGREDTAQDPAIDVIIKNGRLQASLRISLITVVMTAIEAEGEVPFILVNTEETLYIAIVRTVAIAIMVRRLVNITIIGMQADHTIDIINNKIVTIGLVILINNINIIVHQAIKVGLKAVSSLQLGSIIAVEIKIIDNNNR